MRIIKLLAFLFIFSFVSRSAEIIFPEVILQHVPTSFEVIQDDVELKQVKINDEVVQLKKVDGTWKGEVVFKSKELQLEEHITMVHRPVIIPGWMSLLPPLIAIGLALIFKEVISSLFIGIFVGSAVIAVYAEGVLGVFSAFFSVLDHYIIQALMDEGHLAVILFSLTIGSIVAVISKNGGMQGVVNRLLKYAQNRKSGMLTTYFLGIAIFFDDYAITLVVGNTMRSVTDKLKISREKLAYIVDSTAAPIAAIAFITTWIGAELTYISDGVSKIEAEGVEISESAYGIFMQSLGYSFYPIFTLFFVFFIIQKGKDFGPMRKAEKNALNDQVMEESDISKELEEFNPVNYSKVKAFNAVIPIFIVVTGTFVGLLYTGLLSLHNELIDLNISTQTGVWNSLELLPNGPTTFLKKLGLVIGSADSYAALIWASLSGLFVAITLTITQKIMDLRQTMDTVVFGIKTMIPAIAILVLAWALAATTEELMTAEYIKTFFGRDFTHVWIIPALTFVLSAFIAFSTGSSWSTMALMYPLIIPLAFGLAHADPSYNEMAILYNSIASVLAGSVLGDHCSPISDTTILSSLATSCDHIQHVRTQMPYALTVGLVSLLVGIIPSALGISSWFLFPLGIAVLYGIVHFLGKRVY
jgi:Na+/H+ antiporter NhaC